MPIKQTKKPDWDKYIKRIKDLDRTLLANGPEVKSGIIKRTKSGVDVNNKSFKPYSKAYRHNGKVDLTIKGRMLNSILFKRIRNGIKLYFPASENAKAYANQISYRRKFFGLDRKQIKGLKKLIIKAIVKKGS